MTFQYVSLESGTPITRLVLDRGERRNALSLALMREMLTALDQIAADPTTRVVVIEGNGPVFSAGHDLAEIVADRERDTYEQLFGTCAELMTRLHTIPQPVIAKVHGVATAAGCQLVAACDLAIAADDARFATPGVNIGLFCSTPMVPISRTIGRKRMLEMLFTGAMIDAATAAEWGLVNRVVPAADLDAEVVALAERIAESSASVVALGKRAFYDQDGMDERAAYGLACAVMVDNAQADDAYEGMTAFLEEAKTPMDDELVDDDVATDEVVGDEPLIDELPKPTPSSRFRLISFAPFKHSAYARLWTGAFVSNIGTWMEAIALGTYVQDKTGQAAWTGTVAAAAFLPIAFISPLGGALADRFPRKWLLISTNVFQTALAALLTFLFVVGEPSPLTITFIALGNGVAAALGFPAFQALLPDLVPVEDLAGAIALSSAQYNLGRVVGPALAGIVIAIGGYAWAEGVNAVSFLAVVAVLLTLTLPPPAVGARAEKIIASIIDGFRYVRHEPGLRVNALAMCVNTFLAAPFIALVPAMAIEVLGSGKSGTSVLVTAQGIGAVTMAFSLGSLVDRFRPRRVLVVLMAALPFALVAYAYAPNLAVSAIALVVVGALYLGALSSFTTIAQSRAPMKLRGRILAVYTVILGSLYPLGSVVQGKVADHIGLRATTAGAAALIMLTLVATRLIRPGITAAIDTPVD